MGIGTLLLRTPLRPDTLLVGSHTTLSSLGRRGNVSKILSSRRAMSLRNVKFLSASSIHLVDTAVTNTYTTTSAS